LKFILLSQSTCIFTRSLGKKSAEFHNWK
jgi:hypothetical protein